MITCAFLWNREEYYILYNNINIEEYRILVEKNINREEHKIFFQNFKKRAL